MIYDLAIIGGGFSGAAVAYHFLNNAIKSNKIFTCIIFEKSTEFAEGIAYSTKNPVHILNVPAAGMSISNEQPNSFLDFLRSRDPKYQGTDFASRFLYHQYLIEKLDSLQNKLGDGQVFKIATNKIQGIIKKDLSIYELELNNSTKISAKNVVLAMGNSLTENVRQNDLFSDQWNEADINNALTANTIGIIGSGLSAVDLILTLEDRGFLGTYNIYSRHALLPKSHPAEAKTYNTEAIINKILLQDKLLELVKAFRSVRKTDLPWTAVFDAFRQHSQDIWGKLSHPDKLKFIRKIRPYWDIHRHRIPESSANTLNNLINSKRLLLHQANVKDLVKNNNKISLLLNNQKTIGLHDAVFGCSGIWSNLKACNNPIINDLISADLASYDDFFLGFKTSKTGELKNSQGSIRTGLYTLGSLRRGELWETIAVREIRQQAEIIAKEIIAAV